MRAPSPETRVRLASALAAGCSVIFAFQFTWLATLIVLKWGNGNFPSPTRALDIQTDLLFLTSVVLSLVATAINDWGWHTLRDFWGRLPAAGTLLVVLVLAVGGKVQATEGGRSGQSLVPWFDMVEATIWLLLIGGGVRIWHRRNSHGKNSLLSRSLRWVILCKVGLLSLLWVFQCTWLLLHGERIPAWGSCLSDLLYFVGMVAAWLSYMERRGLDLLRGIAGIDTARDESSPHELDAE